VSIRRRSRTPSLLRFHTTGEKARGSVGPRFMGSPRRRGSLFPCSRSPDRSTVSPAVDRLAASFVGVLPLQSSFALTSARSLSGPSHCPGFVPHRDITGEHPPNTARVPSLATFRPRAFSTPRRFSPLSGSEACSILEPRPGLMHVQGLLPPRSAPSSSEAAAPLPLPRPALPDGAFRPGVHAVAPRLRGLPPREDAFTPARCSASPAVAPLFGFQLLQVLHPPA
jgi:hypothetical protein